MLCATGASIGIMRSGPALVPSSTSGLSRQRRVRSSSGCGTYAISPLKFETPIIERYRQRDSSAEESLTAMYLAGWLVVRRRHNRSPPRPPVQSGTTSDLNTRFLSGSQLGANIPLNRSVLIFGRWHLDRVNMERRRRNSF